MSQSFRLLFDQKGNHSPKATATATNAGTKQLPPRRPRIHPGSRVKPHYKYCLQSADIAAMSGAAYLCPLLSAGVDASNTASTTHDAATVVAVAIDPHSAAHTPSKNDVARLAALLSRAESELVPRNEVSRGIDKAALENLPQWAQRVMRSGYTEQSTSHKQPKRESHEDHAEDQVAPRKRPRTFQKKDHLQITANGGDGDEPMAWSQDTEEGGDDGDGPLRSMFTQEERVAEHVDKYSDMMEQLLQSVHERRDSRHHQVDGGGGGGGDADGHHDTLDVFTPTEVKALVQSIKVMDKSALIVKCDSELLLRLMSAMGLQVQIGLGLDVLGTMALDQGDDEWHASGIDLRLMARVQASLDVGICELLVISTPDIDRRILSEETIDHCVQLLSHTIQKLIIPCIDPSSSLVTSNGSARPPSDGPTPTSGAAKARNNARNFTVKHNKNVKKAMDRLLPVVCEFMEQLARLISTVKLGDRWILHFSTMMTKLFLLEFGPHAALLQRSSLVVLRAIFLAYPTHRELILDEVISVMLKLPTAKRNLRPVKLSGSSACVQMITTLIVVLMQVTASAPSPSTSLEGNGANGVQHDPTLLPEGTAMDVDGDDEESGDEREAGGAAGDSDALLRLKEARESARIFVSALLKECMKKHEERDNRIVLENLLEDLLAMFGRPEWAGAEVLLEVFSASLAAILGSNLTKDAKKLESQYSLTALHLIGRICASIKMNQNVAARDTLDDEDSRAVFHEHETYVQTFLDGVAVAEGDTKNRDQQLNRDLVLKHMVLSYMKRSVQEVAHEDSKRMLLTRFLAEKPSKTERGSKYVAVMWKHYWEAKGSSTAIDSSSKLAPPQHELAMRASLQIAVHRDFCGMFSTLMKHLMALLSRGIPTFRARVMKALSGIVDVDPMLMAETGVRETVYRCILDESTSVRQAAVDLVGKYVTLQPLLFERYFEKLCDRLRDKGISVRKSVCKIFRAYLTLSTALPDGTESSLTDDEMRRRSTCMRNLVERIGDATEEDVIKNFIIDTFQETWFGSEFSSRQLSELNGFDDDHSASIGHGKADQDDAPPGWTVSDSGHHDEADRKNKSKIKRQSIEFVSPEGKVFASAEEAWAAYRTPLITPSSVVKSKRSKLDDTPVTVSTIIEVIHDMATMDWFVALLQRLLHDDSSSKASAASNRRVSRDRTDDVSIAKARSAKIVACLIDCLLQLEEGKDLKGVTISDRDAQFLSCVKALGAFCEASPLLLAPHLEVVMVYLKGDDKFSKATEAKVQGLILNMVSNVIAHTERVTDRVASMLEADFKSLVFRAPPSVVGPSIRCLATLSTFTKRPPTLLFKMLETFFGYLVKFQRLESLANLKQDASSSLQRALFTAGQIGGSLDFDTCGFALPAPSNAASSKLTKGSIMEALYEIYSAYLKLPGSPACTAKAVQGLGFLFMLRPRFLLQTQQDGLFDTLLQSRAHEIQLQCLTSLKELLQHEEQRLEKGVERKKTTSATTARKDKSKKGQVQGDQDGEASLIGGVMQAQLKNILSLSLEKHVRIRSEAVACIAVLLTQGLVSPLHCIPNLVALEADQVVSIRDVAHGQLLALHEKFPTLLHQPSIHGVFLSHSFQLNAFDKCHVFTLDKDKKEYCLFGRLYTNCLRPARTQRNMFLRALINQFSDTGNLLSPRNLEAKPLRTIDYLSYLAQFITALPYDVEDEPLFIIYHINRYVTLKLGPTLQDLKKEFKAIGMDAAALTKDDADLNEVDISRYLKRTDYDHDEMRALLAHCCMGFAINLLLRIKFFLKEMYSLDNEKCQTYQPNSATNATDQNVSLAEFAPPRLQLLTPEEIRVDHPLELNWNLLLHTWRAAQEDQSQLDFDTQEEQTSRSSSATKKKKTTRRRKSSVAKHSHIDDEEGEMVEGFDG